VSKPSSTSVTAQPGPARLDSAGPPRPGSHRLRWRLGLLWLALVVIVGGAAWAVHERGRTQEEGGGSPNAGQENLILCWRFAALKNGRQAGADELLGPAAKAPAQPVTPEEAARINADAFLRADLLVLDVRPDDSARGGHRFVLVTKGTATGEPLRVRSSEAVERTQQMVTNPELVIDVYDGRIHAVRAQSAGR